MYRRIVSAAVLSVTVLATAYASDPAPAPMQAASIDADTALAMLKDGNTRFVQGESTFPNLNQDRRCLTTDGGQHPYVSVLSCADSRVPPELLFDAGIGELFVIRVAGNVADTDEIGTLEYGAGHLNTPLILVMGHTKCGAVTAVVKKADVGGSIPKLVDNIIPAVETAREKYPGTPEAKFIQLAIKENVRQAMTDVLRNSEEIRHLVAADKVKIVGAVYDIHNGTIEWLGELPNQTAILDGATAEHGGSHEAPAAELLHGETAELHADNSQAAPATTTHDDHAVTAAKRVDPKDAAQDDSHAPAAKPADPHASPAKKASAHDESPKSKSANGESTHDAADDSHGSHDQSEADHSADTKQGEEHAATAEKQSLVQKHGLLVPGAFLAAGSLLSGSIVFLLKGRAAHASHSDAPQTDSKPAEKSSDAKPAEKKDALIPA